MKFRIRFYVVAECKTAYVYNLFDSRCDNKSSIAPAVAYSSRFRELAETETHMEEAGVSKCMLSALWVLECVKKGLQLSSPLGLRLVVAEKFLYPPRY